MFPVLYQLVEQEMRQHDELAGAAFSVSDLNAVCMHVQLTALVSPVPSPIFSHMECSLQPSALVPPT